MSFIQLQKLLGVVLRNYTSSNGKHSSTFSVFFCRRLKIYVRTFTQMHKWVWKQV